MIIEFVSIGGLVKGITVKDIMGGVSQPRNTVIANVFYRLKLIESYGTGIMRIIEVYNGSSLQPKFVPASASFVTTLPNTHYYINSELSDSDKVISLFETKNEITRKDVEAVLNCSKFAAISVINTLLSEGKIVKIGAARAVKYRQG